MGREGKRPEPKRTKKKTIQAKEEAEPPHFRLGFFNGRNYPPDPLI